MIYTVEIQERPMSISMCRINVSGAKVLLISCVQSKQINMAAIFSRHSTPNTKCPTSSSRHNNTNTTANKKLSYRSENPASAWCNRLIKLFRTSNRDVINEC